MTPAPHAASPAARAAIVLRDREAAASAAAARSAARAAATGRAKPLHVDHERSTRRDIAEVYAADCQGPAGRHRRSA